MRGMTGIPTGVSAYFLALTVTHTVGSKESLLVI